MQSKLKTELIEELKVIQRRIAGLESERDGFETALERLRESEQQFQTLFESVPVGIGVSTHEGKMLLFNNAVPRITGYSEDELRQMNISNLYADPTQREAMLERFRTKGSIQDFKVQMKCKDGSIFYCSLTIIPSTYRGEDVLLTVVKDVTEQVYAEEALRHSEEKFRKAFDNANTGMCLVDLNGILLKVNDKMSEIFGYSKEELEGMSVNDIAHPDYKEISTKFIREILEGQGGGGSFTKCYLHKSGHEVWGEVSSSLVRDSTGKPLYFVSQVQDITERKQVEEALRAQKEQAQKYLDIARVMIVTLDRQGKITLVNKRACEILGYVEGELVGRDWSETCVPERVQEQVHHVFIQMMDGNVDLVECHENPVVTSEGKERLIAWHNTMLRDDSGQVIGTLSSGEDITERKRAEEALRESENRFRIASESSSDLIWEWDIKQGKLEWFGNIDEMLGYGAGEFPRTIEAWGKVIHANDHDRVMATLGRHLDLREPYQEEYRVIKKDGSVLFWMDTGTALWDEHGTPYKMIGAVTDITEPKRAEAAIRESEGKFRMLAEMLPEIVYETDIDGRIIYANRVAFERFGYSQEDFDRGLFFMQMLVPEDLERAKNAIEKMMHGEEINRGDFTAIRKDRTTFDITTYSSVIIKDGKPAGLRGIIVDITERKQAETLQIAVYRISQAVDETESLEELYRSVHVIVQDVMPADNFYISIYDEKRNELSFPYFIDHSEFSSPTRPFGQGMTEYVIRTGAPLLCDVDMRDKLSRSGKAKFVGETPAVWLGIPLKVEKKTIGAMVVQHYDDPSAYGEREQHMLEYVSTQVAKAIEKKRAETALRESEELNRGMVTNTPIGVIYLDIDGTVLYMNPAMNRIMGVGEDGVIPALGHRAESFPNMVEMAIDAVIKRILSGEILQGEEIEYKLLTGKPLLLEIHGAPRRNPEGDIVGAVIMCEDITGFKELENQLLHAQKMEAVGRLAGGIAHDFNNLLTAITGHSDLALMSLDTNDPLRGDVEEILNAAKRAADLTRQLLAFSRKQALEPKVIDLNSVIDEMNKMLKRIIGETIELITIPEKSLWKVRVDLGQLEQVIVNLVVNSADAMTNGGKLTIETLNVELDAIYVQNHPEVTPGQYVMLAVTDTGSGISDEVKAKIFEPFFTTKEAGRGTGLGLSTIYGIVKQSGGHIWVYSAVGKGTTFKVYLPRTIGELEKIPRISQFSKVPRGNETLLIIEDEKAVRDLTVRTLRKLGYRVLEAQGGGEAIIICEKLEKPVDLIITDVIMPEMGGVEFAKRIRKLWPEVKVLYMSGYAPGGMINSGMLEEGATYLQKPFQLNVLACKVREVLEKK